MARLSFNNRNLIVGVGSALIDILIHADDGFIERCRAEKGGMNLVDHAVLQEAMAACESEPQIVPGGSACNTVIGVANLGGKARFVGKRGQDDYGDLFENDLRQNDVSPNLFTASLPTGRVLTIITPDAQRTFLTYLGAAETMLPGEIDHHCFQDAAIVHIEGYLLFNPDLMMAVLKEAKDAGAIISLDLASYTVVESNQQIIHQVIRDYVDILIGNEDEVNAFTGHSDEKKALDLLSKDVEIAVLKVGARGSYVAVESEVFKIDPFSNGDIVDTTGAGDFWAAGFLFGLVNHFPIEQCGRIASMCGFEVCRVVGANLNADSWQRIRKTYDKDIREA